MTFLKLARVSIIAGTLLALPMVGRANEDYSMSDLSIAPPLRPMSGGDYTLEEPKLSKSAAALAGGDFTMEAAITPLPPVIVFGEAEVFVAITDGQAVVTWSTPAAGYILEWSPALGELANWRAVTPSPTEPRFVVTGASGATQFFRLRRE